ncbi:hypothetical protein [Hymenobacter sp. UYP22]|uniref:hypothetical protein n=1 Tax=Hymenobacter sp. UYP22 TaxID=3156348 RepID=UPI0033944472
MFTSYVSSVRSRSGLSDTIYCFSDTVRKPTGDITLTAYDAWRQLVHGPYRVQVSERDEPGKTPSVTRPQCTIIPRSIFTKGKVLPPWSKAIPES